MANILDYKYTKFKQISGLLGVLSLWTFISFGMLKAHLNLIDTRPISYLGIYRPTRLIFTLGLLVSAVLFIVFAIYLAHTYKLRNKFLIYFFIGQTGQIITAIIPDTPHTTFRLIHTIAAFTLAFSLPLLIREFAISQKDSKYSNIYHGLYRFELVTFAIGIGLFVFTNGVAPLGEILPTFGFHLWIIVVSCILIKSKANEYSK